MKLRSEFSILLFTVICSGICPNLLAQNSKQIAAIDSSIAKRAAKNKADEYTDARKVIQSDLNRDGKKDFVVLYALESFGGSNSYVQYLAAFYESKSGGLQLAANEIIGGKNRRSVWLNSVKNGKINLDILDYLPTDAICCPSKKGKVRVTFVKNKFREAKLTK